MSRVEDEVCEMIQQRAKIGLNKYGVTMEREDLTHDEWLEHLQHELMDAIVYIQRLRTREESIVQKLQRLINEPEQVDKDDAEQVDTLSAHRKRLSEEAKESIAKKKAENKVFTGEIFGWDRDGDDMVPNWREQDTIDYMRFRYYEQHWSGNKIAKHFNELELKGKKGGAWTSSMVLRTCRYTYHVNREKFTPPYWWGSEAYHDAIDFRGEA
tara:strand:+ start:185 stop:820 length:636 start_codon:yes stop_codon:yes gene_type:complete